MESTVLKKCGMTQVFREGKAIPVTVLQRIIVTKLETKGSRSLCLIHASKKIKKPQDGTLKKFKTESKKGFLKELDLNYQIKEGDEVKIRAVNKGKGFSGVMKRYGYKGLRASHGTGPTARHAGSMGNRTDPGKVFKGRGAPGREGGKTTSILSAKIIKINEEYVIVSGSVPGNEGTLVFLRQKEVYNGN